tara:strand:+ start:707 stop:1132 length:426 start_codon:yes stop_codon:yes gene_type:complete
MKKNDLKTLIKPLVKECIHEVLIEEGLLSNVVAEVAKGMQGNLVVESRQKQPNDLVREDLQINRKSEEARLKLEQHRAKLMNSINSEAYNGVNLFEGTEPMSQYESKEPKGGAVDLGSPKDAGVDISSLVPGASKIWKAMK